MQRSILTPYLQVAPLATIMFLLVGIPVLTLIVISFWTSDGIDIYPGFSLENYVEVLGSPLTLKLFFDTFIFAGITLLASLFIGFWCSYFLVFHVQNLQVKIALFLVCTIPFWTSNIIRMVSWVPFLGREGVFNSALISAGIIDQPLDFLLYSDFSVVLTYVHLFTLFMIVPIFNSMSKIDGGLIEAAKDAGASGLQILFNIVIPLTKTGIALGAIFVVTLVMGDFFVVKIMSGGQSASVVSAMKNDIDQLYYTQASAMAVVLIAVVLTLIFLILRVVDIRAELSK
jgi:putative spermidine/putrescine transport system permease protein